MWAHATATGIDYTDAYEIDGRWSMQLHNFHMPHGRWLMPSEQLASMGHRVVPGTQLAGQCFSSFELYRAGRHGHEIRKEVGNSIHVPTMGKVWLHMFVNSRRAPRALDTAETHAFCDAFLDQLSALMSR